MNEQLKTLTIEEELLLKYFEKPGPDDTDQKRLMITEIMEVLTDKNNKLNFNNTVYRAIGRALAKNGFRRISYKLPNTNNLVWGWIVKQKG